MSGVIIGDIPSPFQMVATPANSVSYLFSGLSLRLSHQSRCYSNPHLSQG